MSEIVHPSIDTDLSTKLDAKFAIANFIVFQIAWFACVEAVAHDMSALGLAAIVIAFAIHLMAVPNRRNAMVLAIVSVMLGSVIETLLSLGHVTQFANNALTAGVAPLWMIALWALFSTTLNVSLRWIRGKYVVSVVLGAVSGPLCYFAGSKIGALSLPMNYSLVAIGASWMIAMPLLLIASKRWDAMT